MPIFPQIPKDKTADTPCYKDDTQNSCTLRESRPCFFVFESSNPSQLRENKSHCTGNKIWLNAPLIFLLPF